MTDKGLIQALRHCGKFEDMEDYSCVGCPAEGKGCAGAFLLAADRLEALLAENAEMKRELKGAKEYSDYLRNENLCYRKENNHLREVAKMIPQLVSVDERLPENSDEQVLAVVSGFYDGMYGATDLMDAFADALQDCQTVDAVEVCFCKDCKHMEITMSTLCWCNKWERICNMDGKGYCNYGEKRESGTQPQREDV